MIEFALWDQEKSKERYQGWKRRRRTEVNAEEMLRNISEKKKSMIGKCN